MAKKQDPSFDDEFQDEEFEEYEEEGDEDSEFEDEESDEEYDEDEDEEYDEEDEDEEDEKKGGGWRKKALFATAGLLVVGFGAYYVINNYFPSVKPILNKGPYANPGGYGKVAASPSAEEAKPSPAASVEAASPAASPAQVAEKPTEPETAKTAKKAAQPAPVKPVAEKAAKVAKAAVAKPAKPVAPVKKAVKAEELPAETPVAKAAPKKAPRVYAHRAAIHKRTVHRVVVRQARHTSGSYTVQVGAFSQLSNAESLASSLKQAGFPARLSGKGSASGGFTVHSTVVDNRAKAQQMLNAFNNAGHPSVLQSAGRGKFMLQLGKFSSRDRAQALVSELNQKGLYVSVSSSGHSSGVMSKVFVGNYPSREAAQKAAATLRGKNVPAVVVRN